MLLLSCDRSITHTTQVQSLRRQLAASEAREASCAAENARLSEALEASTAAGRACGVELAAAHVELGSQRAAADECATNAQKVRQ